MADDDANAEATEEGGKKSKKTLLLIIIGVVVVLLLGGGGALTYFMLSADPDAEVVEEAPSRVEAIYTKIRTLEGKPMFVVSLKAVDGSPHYMQLYVEAKSRDAAVDEAMKLHMPLIVSRLNSLFSGQDFDELRTLDAKRKMQQDALELVQGIMQDKIGQAGVESILFTNLVMQ